MLGRQNGKVLLWDPKPFKVFRSHHSPLTGTILLFFFFLPLHPAAKFLSTLANMDSLQQSLVAAFQTGLSNVVAELVAMVARAVVYWPVVRPQGASIWPL